MTFKRGDYIRYGFQLMGILFLMYSKDLISKGHWFYFITSTLAFLFFVIIPSEFEFKNKK